ncbi:MAG: PQQ-like beta-propeller repeat protein [Dehalococcoidales bacterium]|nr:PQQ-like beta-propeller repeat protein [Dehalococcoidales bacterium]MDP6737612.1 PQQ-like beta-propeller repeat protein [Dehalococcoidales bacterium]
MITKLKRILYSRKLLLSAFLLACFVVAGCAPAGITVPRGWSGGVVADGTLFIGAMDGKIVALNTTDGKRLWEVPLEDSVVAIYGSPTVAGDLVYLGGYHSGKMYAFAQDKIRWVYPRDRAFVDSTGKIAQIIGGAIIAQGKVFFGVDNGVVYALDAMTGDYVWEFPTGGKIWSTPAISDDTLFVGSFDKKLYALDTATGNERWTFDTQGAIVATPLVHDDTVYIGSFDRKLYAVDVITGQEKWRFSEAKNWFWAKPLAKDNTIYASNLDGKGYALDARSGDKLVEFDLGSPVSASPVLVGNRVIVATENGAVYAIDVENKESNKLRDPLQTKDIKVYAPLTTDGVVVYMHTSDGKLYAFDAVDGSELNWSPISLKQAAVPPPPSQQSSGQGMNWGSIIALFASGIVLVLVIQRLFKRRGS